MYSIFQVREKFSSEPAFLAFTVEAERMKLFQEHKEVKKQVAPAPAPAPARTKALFLNIFFFRPAPIITPQNPTKKVKRIRNIAKDLGHCQLVR